MSFNEYFEGDLVRLNLGLHKVLMHFTCHIEQWLLSSLEINVLQRDATDC